MLQEHPPADPEQKMDPTTDNPPEGGNPNPALPEMESVAVHDEMGSGEIPAHALGTETHVAVESEQKIDPAPDSPLEGAQPNPGSPQIAPVTMQEETNLEDIPVHVLGLDAIKKGAPIGRGGMSTVFNGKYGPIPVALKQAVGSVQMLVNEATIITKMHHPNVIQAYGIWKNADHEVFMVYVIV